MYSKVSIDLGAIRGNYQILASLAPKVIAVLKANAYGLGVDLVVPSLLSKGCLSFAVAYLNEGINLRQITTAEIFVLNATSQQHDLFIKYNLIPVFNTVEDAIKGKGHPSGLHIDTGMNRHGIPWQDYIQNQDQLKTHNWNLVMSHLSSADLVDHASQQRQLQAVHHLKLNHPNSCISLANSCGIFLGQDYHFDAVRPGMALYGMNPTLHSNSNLEFCIDVSAQVIQIFHLATGESVGYHESFVAPCPMKIATLAIGYADGIPWRAGNQRSSVLFNDKEAKIIGRVSMDLMSVDITHIPNVQVGDFATIFSKQRPFEIWAKECGVSHYEFLFHLGHRLQRITKNALIEANPLKNQTGPLYIHKKSDESFEVEKIANF